MAGLRGLHPAVDTPKYTPRATIESTTRSDLASGGVRVLMKSEEIDGKKNPESLVLEYTKDQTIQGKIATREQIQIMTDRSRSKHGSRIQS